MLDNGLPTASQPHSIKERLGPKSWLSRTTRRLRQFADWVEAVNLTRNRRQAEHDIRTFADKVGALSQDDRRLETATPRYNATDAVWHDIEGDGFLVPLREHVRRLCTACLEIAPEARRGDWDAVAHNLKLAYSLNDLSADTDIDGAGMWCSPVADYDSVDSEVTAKHLAATIVFTFVWSAYERAVATVCPSKIGKGAKGRDMIVDLASCHMPHLRDTLFDALELDRSGTNFRHTDMRRMLKAGSVAGVAAEHLRQFRNRLIHGDMPRPEPGDWGDKSEYFPNRDCGLRRFHANIRLLLLLIQILVREDVHDGLELDYQLEEPHDARLSLKYLHCDIWTRLDLPELDLDMREWPLPVWR